MVSLCSKSLTAKAGRKALPARLSLGGRAERPRMVSQMNNFNVELRAAEVCSSRYVKGVREMLRIPVR